MTSETFGRYRIDKELGRGAMGRVLLAHDPQIDRRVAIKTVNIFAALPEDERARANERFLQEVRAAGKLLHPNIVTVFDVGQQGGVPFLAMEYVEGQTLDRFTDPQRLLPIATAIELVAGIADGLHYAHQQGIVHRDIKPSNLIRVDERVAKIMDFGLAKGPQAGLTHDGALLGTPSYMSPEQIRGKEVAGASDLFSLAVVLYELVTGSKPFGGESVSSVLFRIVNEDPRDAAELAARVPAGLAQFISKALAKRPADRYANGDQFARALRAVAAATTTSGARAPRIANESRAVPPPAPARKRRSSPLPYVFGMALLFAAVAAGYVYREPLLALAGWAPPTAKPLPVAWLEATVRTEPPGLPVTLDGEALAEGRVRFASSGPFGVLGTTQGCRSVEHPLSASDAGQEIVLVPDPIRLEVPVDPGVPGAQVSLNGKTAGSAPVGLTLDLCRENVIEIAAAGHQPYRVELPPEVTPLEARARLAEIALEPIPMGRLVLPAGLPPLRLFIDGEAVARTSDAIELEAGSHTLRVVNRELWIDVSIPIEIVAGETAGARLSLPAMAELKVQAFPSNCKVSLRRPGGSWVYLDTTPLARRIASGKYEVRVEFVPTGEVRERTVDLRPGSEPVRFSFAGSR